MGRGGTGTIPVVCYKKLADGSEVVIKRFDSVGEAKEWATTNTIMGHGSVQWTLNNNAYIKKLHWATNRKEYSERHLYRFSKILNSNIHN
ncbi:hypothetical protein IQ781_04320 [Bacillus sp. N447-1]|uniref:hypothetical protein n=1 Tax=Bacillus TaxID=1386 RepID=UPI001F60A3A0|nr:hypothetical protein [Bacillus sp. N447-1]UNT69835.1 hypothetical protein IQ781_04320 [Bacillus sp. N447-1]